MTSRTPKTATGLPAGHHIRAMMVGDLPDIVALEQVCQDHPWSQRQFEDELDNDCSHIDLYIWEGRLAGFVCSWFISGELQIQNVAVDPEFRRRGIAARLLEGLLSCSSAKGLEKVWLEVRAGNLAAIKLYEKLGFQHFGTRRRYYHDGEDACIMTFDATGESHPRRT